MYQLEDNALVSFGILLVDFIESEENLSTENTFKEFCESKEPKKFVGAHFGGGGTVLITNHGRIIKIPIPTEFELVELTSIQESHSITDIYCYGILKRESIERAGSDPQEVRNLIDKAQDNLERFIKPRISGIFSRDELEDGYGLLPVRILHLNPEITSPFCAKMIDHKLIYDEESVDQWMKKNSSFLNVFGFNTDAFLSKENFNLVSKIYVWGDYRSGFVLVSFHGLSHEKYCPIHHILPSDMSRMLRTYYWSQFRSKQINSEKKIIETFYQRLQDTNKGKPISHLSKRLNEADMIYSDILEWQINLLTSLTQIRDEIEHFKIHLYNLDAAYDFEKCLSAVKPDSKADMILIGGEPKFDWRLLLSIYEKTKIAVNGLNNNFNILEERQKTLVRYMHDLMNTLTAMGNINFQREIRNLTRGSLIVAMIALFIAFVAIFLK